MAEALKQEKPDEEKNILEQAVGVVDKIIPDTDTPGRAAERGGVFDIDPRPGATGKVGARRVVRRCVDPGRYTRPQHGTESGTTTARSHNR